MKKLIFTLISATLVYVNADAQACGNSGTGVCTPSGLLTEPGLSPLPSDLASVINGSSTPVDIQFKNFNTFVYQGINITINSLRIDSILNLPAGTCWATNKTNNTWSNQEDGCIKVSGTTCADPGQYKLRILVTANTSIGTIGPNLDAETVNLKYFVRVKNNGDADVAVDTNQTAAFVKLTGYSAASAGCTGVGINEVPANVSALNIVPNPMNSQAIVSFMAAKSGNATERITNMIGSEVYSNNIDVKAGENTTSINRNNLPAGIYFYTIVEGTNSTTKRFVVAD
jgi:hypothetical protein